MAVYFVSLGLKAEFTIISTGNHNQELDQTSPITVSPVNWKDVLSLSGRFYILPTGQHDSDYNATPIVTAVLREYYVSVRIPVGLDFDDPMTQLDDFRTGGKLRPHQLKEAGISEYGEYIEWFLNIWDEVRIAA